VFRKNLIGILSNLPLILTDTQDVKDVSLNRVIALVLFIVILLSFFFMSYIPVEHIDKFIIMWNSLVVFLGTLTGINLIKKFVPKS